MNPVLTDMIIDIIVVSVGVLVFLAGFRYVGRIRQ